MSKVFADAFYFIALLNPSDRYHVDAKRATAAINSRIVTTVWVLMEVGDALSAPSARLRTHMFLRRMLADANLTVIKDVEPWLDRGIELFGERSDKEWSLTDCISFEVMNHRGIGDALTGDHHFSQAGFRALLLPGKA